ncbi:MAG: hypothetical protein LUO80_05260 [Methylococcaceae bacterium]|jgi:Aromatic-ring-opening dioxygenase LigAB, LigA subunit|nr:hypothetical protein [Methylococcaceae bacterium]
MSVNTIEKILWEFGDEPSRVKEFLKDPDGYLAGYQLAEEEFRMVRTMDVKALGAYGVSNMLLMMSWPLLHGNNPLLQFDYLRKMNSGELPNNFQLPGWQFNMIRFALWVRKAWVAALRCAGLGKSLT